jgi:phosphoribosylformylglycinamidine synthase subunit PurQ / glutaminase
MKPTALILRSAGTNCDDETAHAFELAGAHAQKMHINQLLHDPAALLRYQMLAIPGGFSYGDDIAAGRILANQIAHHLHDELHRFVELGRPVIGICNGFQVLVKTDLLPGPVAGRTGQTVTLTHNSCGHFVDRWVKLASRSGKCIWTRRIDELQLPIAHGEGRFVPSDESIRQSLWDHDQIALVYAAADGSAAAGHFPDNPNGSCDDIAGICDESGLVLGLMPHPERYVDAIQHPAWTRQRTSMTHGAGRQIFVNAVVHVEETCAVGI